MGRREEGLGWIEREREGRGLRDGRERRRAGSWKKGRREQVGRDEGERGLGVGSERREGEWG
jgi:hypothetical protein